MGSFRDNNLFQAWLVLLLAVLFGISLAAVQANLGPRIEFNKIQETLQQVPVVVLGASRAEDLAKKGSSLTIKPLSIEVEKGDRKKFYTVYQATFRDKTLAGWAAKAEGPGYADKIELLVGLGPSIGTVTGFFVLDQKETPGLGNRIVEPGWQNQFIQKATETAFTIVKNRAGQGNEIDAISGATISSKCVAAIINQTVSDLRNKLVFKPMTKQKEAE